EDVHGAGLGQEHEVVVDGGGRRGRVPDADVAGSTVAGDPVVRGVDGVVDGDVVLDEVVARRAFDVDAAGAVVVDRVADQPAAGDVEVVDAVIAVVVRDVVHRQVVVAARIELQPRVLVVVQHVAGDGVGR